MVKKRQWFWTTGFRHVKEEGWEEGWTKIVTKKSDKKNTHPRIMRRSCVARRSLLYTPAHRHYGDHDASAPSKCKNLLVRKDTQPQKKIKPFFPMAPKDHKDSSTASRRQL